MLSHLHLHIYFLHRQKSTSLQQPSTAPRALSLWLSCLTVPTVTRPAAVSGEEGAGDSGDVKAEEGGGARQLGNVGQGGWRGSGLGGGQPERAAASALGNIVFSWLVAQDMLPAQAPPPNTTTAVLSQNQGFLERGLEEKGSPLRPYAWFSSHSHLPSPQLIPTAPGTGFSPLPNCTHLLTGSQRAKAEKLETQVL